MGIFLIAIFLPSTIVFPSFYNDNSILVLLLDSLLVRSDLGLGERGLYLFVRNSIRIVVCGSPFFAFSFLDCRGFYVFFGGLLSSMRLYIFLLLWEK